MRTALLVTHLAELAHAWLRRWIERDLAAVDRIKTPWLVVGVHRMFYADSSDYRSNDDADQTVAARMRSSLEDLFRDAKVQAAEHQYHWTPGSR